MKNIHLLPTEKPSRLFKFANQLHLDAIPKDYYKKYNIYITSDEEIKEGDAVIHNFGMGYELEIPCDSDNLKSNTRSKIILTTDQDLIADGVQSIDDEFLEWFVKNPSCEYVKTELLNVSEVLWEEYFKKYGVYPKYPYYEKIIIPQEESKCTCEEHDPYCCEVHGICPTCVKKEEPKQETIEEVAENYCSNNHAINEDRAAWQDIEFAFKDGANWQAERMYSEEDMRKAYFSGISSTGEGWNGEYADGNDPNIEEKFSEGFTKWFEQFKKK